MPKWKKNYQEEKYEHLEFFCKKLLKENAQQSKNIH